jgi:hypothetical protein
LKQQSEFILSSFLHTATYSTSTSFSNSNHCFCGILFFCEDLDLGDIYRYHIGKGLGQTVEERGTERHRKRRDGSQQKEGDRQI